MTDKGCIVANIEGRSGQDIGVAQLFIVHLDPLEALLLLFITISLTSEGGAEAGSPGPLCPGAARGRNIPQMMDDTKGKYCFVQGKEELGGNKNMRKAINKSFFNFPAGWEDLLVARGSLLVASLIPSGLPPLLIYLHFFLYLLPNTQFLPINKSVFS